MRLYTFINFYLSSIQQGIQTAHILGELANEVFNETIPTNRIKMIRDWSRNHKTIVVCNGGNADSIFELILFFQQKDNHYPWALFNEDEASLNEALTGVGIILPEEIYDVTTEFVYDKKSGIRNKQFVTKDGTMVYNDPESYVYQLIDRIKSAPLAR